MWKILSESVVGTSHERVGKPCQDSCLALATRPGDEEFLVAACADGAGSAERSDLGSLLACETLTRRVCDRLQQGAGLDVFDRDYFVEAFHLVQSSLRQEADRIGVSERELACTLIVAVVGEHGAVFAQVGDGAIVVSDADQYSVVFWPDRGEYADTTTFVTSPRIGEALQYCRRPPTDGVVLFTDGLQGLALDYANRAAFRGFVEPMLDTLRNIEDATDLIVSFQAFMKSAAVNERTDDDKTLVLAVRVGSDSVRP